MAKKNDVAAPKSLGEAAIACVWELPTKLRIVVVIVILLGAGAVALPEWVRTMLFDRVATNGAQRADGPRKEPSSPTPQPAPATPHQEVRGGSDDATGVLAMSPMLNVSVASGRAAWVGVRSGDKFYPLMEAGSVEPPIRIAAPPHVAEGRFVLVVVDEATGRSFQDRLNAGESFSFSWESFTQFPGTVDLNQPFVRPGNSAFRRTRS
jgi:hypothetical protein